MDSRPSVASQRSFGQQKRGNNGSRRKEREGRINGEPINWSQLAAMKGQTTKSARGGGLFKAAIRWGANLWAKALGFGGETNKPNGLLDGRKGSRSSDPFPRLKLPDGGH